MATQPAEIPFAVDSDITPLQGKFFASVTQNVRDPNLRSQLYDKVRSTFGGIQQARDIQRIKLQEDEDRAIGLELRRAQLDNSRMELGLARDKVRQQQEAAAKTGEFNSTFDDFVNYELDGLSPEEAKKKLNMFGAQYADVLVYNPAAKAKLDLTNNALETQRRGSEFGAGYFSDLSKLSPQAAELIHPGSTEDRRWLVGHLANKDKQAKADQRIALAGKVATSNTAQTLADNLHKDLSERIEQGTAPERIEQGTAPPWSKIDVTLEALDKGGFITPEEKVQLLEFGINPLKKPTDTARKKADTKTAGGMVVLRDIMAAASARALASKSEADAYLTNVPAERELGVADNAELYGVPTAE
jgi:hypothetical protein